MFSLSKQNVLNTVARTCNWIRANRSQIEFVVGLGCIAGGGIATAIGGWKSNDIYRKRMIEACDYADELEDEGLDEKEIDKEILKHRIGTYARIGLSVAPGAALTAIGMGLVTHSHNMQAEQITALTTAYNGLLTLHNRWKAKAQEKLGEEKMAEIEQELAKEDAEAKGIDWTDMDAEELATVLCGGNSGDPTVIVFDEKTSRAWDDKPTANINFIAEMENVMQRNLDNTGVAWLSDALECLEIVDADVKYPLARFMGWTTLGPKDPRDGKDDGNSKVIVDFGLKEHENNYAAVDIFKYDGDNRFVLKFNHMGVITDIVGQADPLVTR